MLVNKCSIYDEDSSAHSAHYKSLSEKKGKNQYHGNGTVLQLRRGSIGFQMRNIQVGEETSAYVKFFKCGVAGHHSNDCGSSEKRCFNCGKT